MLPLILIDEFSTALVSVKSLQAVRLLLVQLQLILDGVNPDGGVRVTVALFGAQVPAGSQVPLSLTVLEPAKAR
jgi:hypothetical protein